MLDVIGVGFGRTGTLSLKAALEQLGFGPCQHMDEVLAHRRHTIPYWTDAADGKPVNWEALFEGCRSTVDWPGARFWRELVEAYPAARVIHTVRDPERWYASARNTIFRAVSSTPPNLNEQGRQVVTMMNALIWDGVFGGRFADRDRALEIFAEHTAAVRREVPARRLLVFDVTHGWEPLCDFLGVPVPAGPFPRANATAAFAAKQRERFAAATVPDGSAAPAQGSGPTG
ncbi:conserved hypothetical protein [Frankia canadensis]|uniref:Sulfotransferase family protein n=1 Tax=Frankia canadensis TaxID=1836972 RepID=A0A2I2KP95_9ACTN|nr:sulfotransferase family protein [Frankia canadensis]SNQ47476.1 conserved hypothetical protein [Frankia canadensis]SOU54766.1 conserved hypothetical protein [Frankia canadensis]